MTQHELFSDSEPEPHGAHRCSDPDTSVEAAHAMRGNRLTAIQQAVIDFAERHGPFTDEELEDGLGFKYGGFSTLRKRRSELFQAGRLIDTGNRRTNRGGRKMIVWAKK